MTLFIIVSQTVKFVKHSELLLCLREQYLDHNNYLEYFYLKVTFPIHTSTLLLSLHLGKYFP